MKQITKRKLKLNSRSKIKREGGGARVDKFLVRSVRIWFTAPK